MFFKFIRPELNTSGHWLLGISPEGIGILGMILNFVVSITVSALTPRLRVKFRSWLNIFAFREAPVRHANYPFKRID